MNFGLLSFMMAYSRNVSISRDDNLNVDVVVVVVVPSCDQCLPRSISSAVPSFPSMLFARISFVRFCFFWGDRLHEGSANWFSSPGVIARVRVRSRISRRVVGIGRSINDRQVRDN